MLERTNKRRNFGPIKDIKIYAFYILPMLEAADHSMEQNGNPQKQNIRVKSEYFKLHEKRWIISDT